MIGPRSNNRIATALGLTGLTILLAFQNCAPTLPSESMELGSEVGRTRPTPLPASFATPPPGSNGTHTSVTWEGVCTNQPSTTQPMIIAGTDDYGALLVFNNADGSAALWSTKAVTFNRSSVCRMTTANWSVKATGDFNGDGTVDVLWRNTDGQTAVWLMWGASRMSGGFLPTSDTQYKIIGTGDFNADGKTDLLWARVSDGAMVIWQMDGKNTPTVVSVNTAKPADHSLAWIADFNGDRKADLMWRATNGALLIWRMDGGTVAATGTPRSVDGSGNQATVGNEWQVKAVGDFDGDTKADLFWYKPASRELVLWKMNEFADIIAYTNFQALPAGYGNVLLVKDADADQRADIFWTYATDVTSLIAWRIPGSGISAMSLGSPIVSGWTPFTYDVVGGL